MCSDRSRLAKSEDAEKQAQELAIRATVEQFARAYNAHDAKAVADLFLPQAQLVDEDDNTIQGRDNIQNLFADVFEEQPETGINVDIESIRFIGTNLALEMGSTTTVPPAGANSGSRALQCSAYPERWKMVDGSGSRYSCRANSPRSPGSTRMARR